MSARGILSAFRRTSHFCSLTICSGSWRTLLLVDLELDVVVDTEDDQVADGIECPDRVEDIRVFKGDLLSNLDHTKDDHNVGATMGKTRSAWMPQSV